MADLVSRDFDGYTDAKSVHLRSGGGYSEWLFVSQDMSLWTLMIARMVISWFIFGSFSGGAWSERVHVYQDMYFTLVSRVHVVGTVLCAEDGSVSLRTAHPSSPLHCLSGL